MDLSFKPKEITKSEDRSQIADTVLSMLQDKYATELLNIGNIEIGECFKGICYVSNSTFIRNANDKNLYDGRFELIDGNGKRFKATYWGLDTNNFTAHNSLAYVEGTYYLVGNGNQTRKIYRLDKISQSTIDVPKHIFYKYIPDIEKYKTNFESEMGKLVDTQLIKFYEVLKSKGIVENLEQVPFDDFYYVEMGSSLKVYMSILLDAVNFNRIYNLNFDLLRVGLALALWKPQIVLSSSTNREINLEYNYMAEQCIYSTEMTLEKRIALFSFIKDENSTIESMFVKQSIEKYQNLLKLIDKTVEKADDVILF